MTATIRREDLADDAFEAPFRHLFAGAGFDRTETDLWLAGLDLARVFAHTVVDLANVYRGTGWTVPEAVAWKLPVLGKAVALVPKMAREWVAHSWAPEQVNDLIGLTAGFEALWAFNDSGSVLEAWRDTRIAADWVLRYASAGMGVAEAREIETLRRVGELGVGDDALVASLDTLAALGANVGSAA